MTFHVEIFLQCLDPSIHDISVSHSKLQFSEKDFEIDFLCCIQRVYLSVGAFFVVETLS